MLRGNAIEIGHPCVANILHFTIEDSGEHYNCSDKIPILLAERSLINTLKGDWPPGRHATTLFIFYSNNS